MGSSVVIISSIVVLIVVLLFVGAPLKPMRWLMQGSVKLVIGVLFLFFFNVFGASLGLHLPINGYTAVITGFLGIPGLVSLAALHLFVFV
ncbi:pro-sigmaK processing inhibitor BofA family protein [Paraliobacillus sediminis]|uniref:pro-sigmaK processing inhibitor BofA family protein n=1 Tax=Paraliobacillus sediminis TaxID=1885916 RepID=UPI000E3DB608|nr:pro-sigmaK processing inhibitor BofA family protein [Paraliobacillus sediminis]